MAWPLWDGHESVASYAKRVNLPPIKTLDLGGGVKMELVQDPETPGFHHIHLRVADPEASLKWYVDTFGGDRAKLKGRLDAVKYSNPNVWLLAQKGEDAAPSQGHAIDHLGWAVANVGAKVADLTAKGAKPIEVETTATSRLSINPVTNLSLPGMARNHCSE